MLLTLGNEFYTVEPIRRYRREKSFKRSATNFHVIKRFMATDSPTVTIRNPTLKKKKRSTPLIVTIETAIFVDAALYSHMVRNLFPDNTEEEVTHFILAMINAVGSFIGCLLIL